MQEKDMFNGVIGKYIDCIDENGIAKRKDDMETKLTVPRPREWKKTQLFNSCLFSSRMYGE